MISLKPNNPRRNKFKAANFSKLSYKLLVNNQHKNEILVNKTSKINKSQEMNKIKNKTFQIFKKYLMISQKKKNLRKRNKSKSKRVRNNNNKNKSQSSKILKNKNSMISQRSKSKKSLKNKLKNPKYNKEKFHRAENCMQETKNSMTAKVMD